MDLLIVLFTRYETIYGLPLSAASLSRCITCQDVCVQESHAGYLSVIANEPRLYTKKHSRTKKIQKACVANKNICVYVFELKR